MCISNRMDGPAAGAKLHIRPSVGTGGPGRASRPSRGSQRCRGEALPCHAATQRCGEARRAFSMKSVLETAPVEAANSAIPWRSAKAGGPARPDV